MDKTLLKLYGETVRHHIGDDEGGAIADDRKWQERWQQDLRNLTNYCKSYKDQDFLWLLTKIKKSASRLDNTQHKVLTFIKCIQTLFAIKQWNTKVFKI